MFLFLLLWLCCLFVDFILSVLLCFVFLLFFVVVVCFVLFFIFTFYPLRVFTLMRF